MRLILNKNIDLIILSMFFVFFMLIVYLAAIGYSNIVSIVTPVSLFIGFWIWMKQEKLKRCADSAENLLNAYWEYEKTVLTIIFSLHDILKIHPLEVDKEKIIYHLNKLKSFTNSALESELDFYLAAKIFIYKTFDEDQHTSFESFINEFSNFRYIISLTNQITDFEEYRFSFLKLGNDINSIKESLDKIGKTEKQIITELTLKPINIIENQTLKYLNLDTLGSRRLVK